MRKIFALIITTGLISGVISAKPVQQKKRPAPSTTAVVKKAPVKPVNAVYSDLIKALPQSDLVAVIDGKRLFNEVVPALSQVQNVKIDKAIADLREGATKVGIDLTKVGTAVFGQQFKEQGQTPAGLVVSGLNLDKQKLSSLIKSYDPSLTVEEYKGHSLHFPKKEKKDEALSALTGDRLVIGDLEYVKQVVDIDSGVALPKVSPILTDALNETKPSALIRFALNIPKDLKEKASTQGEMFQAVSTIKYVRGTLDTAKDLSVSLDMLARTGSAKDATDLVTGLNALVMLGRGFLGGGDSKLAALEPLLDQLRINSTAADVTFSLAVPRAMLEELSKK